MIPFIKTEQNMKTFVLVNNNEVLLDTCVVCNQRIAIIDGTALVLIEQEGQFICTGEVAQINRLSIEKDTFAGYNLYFDSKEVFLNESLDKCIEVHHNIQEFIHTGELALRGYFSANGTSEASELLALMQDECKMSWFYPPQMHEDSTVTSFIFNSVDDYIKAHNIHRNFCYT